jgi:hypothetical protein
VYVLSVAVTINMVTTIKQHKAETIVKGNILLFTVSGAGSTPSGSAVATNATVITSPTVVARRMNSGNDATST